MSSSKEKRGGEEKTKPSGLGQAARAALNLRHPPGATIPGVNEAHDFWLNRAHLDPAAAALASRIKVILPASRRVLGIRGSLIYPIRRLIVTGEDKPENFRIFFGEEWEECIGKIWQDVRMEVLLCPPPGSPSHTMAAAMDDSTLPWRPRPPTDEELQNIEQVRRMQRMLLAGALADNS